MFDCLVNVIMNFRSQRLRHVAKLESTISEKLVAAAPLPEFPTTKVGFMLTQITEVMIYLDSKYAYEYKVKESASLPNSP